jgi:uncharacterized protein YukE
MPDFKATYNDIESVGSRLQNQASEIEQGLQGLLKLVDQLVSSGFVTDAASPAFQQSYQEITKGGMQVMHGISGLGKFLHVTVSGTRQLDQDLAKQLGKH